MRALIVEFAHNVDKFPILRARSEMHRMIGEPKSSQGVRDQMNRIVFSVVLAVPSHLSDAVIKS